MATYNQLSYGSRGSKVAELQKLLNQNGYNLDVDGQYGVKTRQAVIDYQRTNSLDADGIAGENTWGTLTKAATGTTTDAPTNTATANPYGEYKPSDAVAQAEALLKQQLAQKPGEYTSAWQSQLNDTLDKILNREKFTYDLNGDMLYQQYKDQYTTQGQMAMMDTMGKAAALTGGYGNSYAQTAGQQAYQGYLQQLNDKVPELYQLALNQYNREGDEMYNQAALMAQMEDQDYGRYRDSVSDYYAGLDRAYNQYNTERDYDYSKWADGRNFDYQTERDKIADEQWLAEFEEAKRQYDQQYELQKKSSSSGSSSSSKSSSSSSTKKSSDKDKTKDDDKPVEVGNNSYYDSLLGAVSTAKGLYSKQTSTERQKAYKESVAAINSAYSSGQITKEQKNELLRIATPSSR